MYLVAVLSMLWTTLALGQVVDVEHVALRLPPSALILGAFGGGLAAGVIANAYCTSPCVGEMIQPTIAGVVLGGLVGLLAGSVLGGKTHTWVRRVP